MIPANSSLHPATVGGPPLLFRFPLFRLYLYPSASGKTTGAVVLPAGRRRLPQLFLRAPRFSCRWHNRCCHLRNRAVTSVGVPSPTAGLLRFDRLVYAAGQSRAKWVSSPKFSWAKSSASSMFSFAVCIAEVKTWIIIVFPEASLPLHGSVHTTKFCFLIFKVSLFLIHRHDPPKVLAMIRFRIHPCLSLPSGYPSVITSRVARYGLVQRQATQRGQYSICFL